MCDEFVTDAEDTNVDDVVDYDLDSVIKRGIGLRTDVVCIKAAACDDDVDVKALRELVNDCEEELDKFIDALCAYAVTYHSDEIDVRKMYELRKTVDDACTVFMSEDAKNFIDWYRSHKSQ